MDPFLLLLLALMAFMIVGALIAAETEDLLSAVICVGAVGAALAIIFLFLGAPDLAITQVVVEILTVALLIRIVLHRRDETYHERHDTFTVGGVLLALGVLLVLGGWAMVSLNEFGVPLLAGPEAGAARDYLLHGMTEVSSANHVTSVLLDYRAYDTLGEVTVIFCSIIGAYAILRRTGRVRHGGHESHR